MEIDRELIAYVEENLLVGARPPAGLATDDALIARGFIDSLGLMQLLAHVEQRWQVDLLEVASPDDFVSVATLARAIRRHVGV